MPEVEIRGGNTFWSPDRQEMRQLYQEVAAEQAKQRASADNIKRMELTVPVSAPATTLFVSQTNFMGTPDEGYVWSLKLITCQLAAAGTLAAFKASTTADTRRCLGVTTGVTVGSLILAELTWSSDQAELKHGEGVFLQSSQNISNVYMVGEQVTAEKAAHIYD